MYLQDYTIIEIDMLNKLNSMQTLQKKEKKRLQNVHKIETDVETLLAQFQQMNSVIIEVKDQLARSCGNQKAKSSQKRGTLNCMRLR